MAARSPMPVPTYDQFIEPLLRVLSQHPDGMAARQAAEAAAAALGVTEEQKQELLPSGAQPIYRNRAGWAHDRLKRAGLSSSPRRGSWQITQAGREFRKRHAQPLPAEVARQLAMGTVDVRLRPAAEDGGEASTAAVASPDDRLGEALLRARNGRPLDRRRPGSPGLLAYGPLSPETMAKAEILSPYLTVDRLEQWQRHAGQQSHYFCRFRHEPWDICGYTSHSRGLYRKGANRLSGGLTHYFRTAGLVFAAVVCHPGAATESAGTGIHWPDLDEDLSFESLHRGVPAPQSKDLIR